MIFKTRIHGFARELHDDAEIGRWADGKRTWRLFRFGAGFALHCIDRENPATERTAEMIGMKDAALWLAEHGLTPPREMWDALKGRYDFNADGTPIMPELPITVQPTHSADFTSVNWFGTQFQFAKGLQAESVRILWEAWENGTPSLSEKTIGDLAGSASDSFRLFHVFAPSQKGTGKRIAHAAWETMIVSTGKGMFALFPPKK